MKKTTTIILAFLLVCLSTISAQISSDELAKWEARKYSMFIHWGIYSELGGVWNGKNISYGLSEQIQSHAGIYSDTYTAVAKRFNPTQWSADDVVLLAKAAGMKSIVFTSKHHDGFCMYHSKYTDFNVVDATPYKRDVLKELSEACARHGLKMSLYYSLIDWHYPQASPISSHNSDYITPEHFEFNKKQVEELLTNYGEISELWFDMGSHSFEQSKELRDWVRKLQPNCMIGGRIGNGMGDFMVMGDNQEPDYTIGVPWQSPASFFDETWSYRSWQVRGSKEDKLREKLTSLIQVCGRGGNFLLNIGPRGDGSVVEFEKDILLEIGKWLDKNGEAIYNTHADPFHKNFEWGSVTAADNSLYLHLLNTPKDGQILLPELKGSISNVSILGEKNMTCKTSASKDGVVIQLPKNLDTKLVNVVKLSFKKGYQVPPTNIIALDKDTKLNQENAFKYFSHSGVDYNSIYQSTIKESWTLLPSENKVSTPHVFYTEQESGKTITLQLNGEEQNITLFQDRPINLDNEINSLRWGKIYLQGPVWASLSSMPKSIKDINLSEQKDSVVWVNTDFKNNQTYTIPGGLLNGYYLVQEIESPTEQQILISVTSGDGVVIALNGDKIVNHGNLLKENMLTDIVLLNLKKGKNQLFVKLFSNFNKNITFNINNDIPQVIYVKKLNEVTFKKDQYFPISWKLKNPIAPHETLNTPNMNLWFE